MTLCRLLIGYCHSVYGIIYHKKKEWDKSREYFEKCIKIKKDAEDLEGLSQDHYYYGRMLADKGDKDKARNQFEKSIACLKRLKRSWDV